MSAYSTSSSSDSLLSPHLFSTNTSVPLYMHCLLSSPSSFIFISYNITNMVLLLPLCIFILYHGLQQWRSTSSAVTMSHSDSFSYHMMTLELIGVFGCTLCFYGVYKENVNILQLGFVVMRFLWYGEIFFHVLTCIERYLAVVHPITYLSLRKERGVRIRNICIGCAWLLCFLLMALLMIVEVLSNVDICLLIVSFVIISFCSLSVLWVLFHPGPGDRFGRRERVDQSKLRAFYTIMAILGVLALRLAWSLGRTAAILSGRIDCVMMTCEVCVNLPCSLLSPLLFLHRKGKCVCSSSNRS